MSKHPSTGILTFTFSLGAVDKEVLDQLDEGQDPDDLRQVKVEMTAKCGPYTANDFNPDHPAQFIKQGSLMSIMEALARGLHSDRGTNMVYAAEDAGAKMRKAERAIGKIDEIDQALDMLLSKLEKKTPELENMHTEGNC